MGRAKIIILITVSALIVLVCPAWGETNAVYLYNLSDFSGIVPFSAAKVSVDALRKETYVITGDLIRVFNASGMEIYSFGDGLNVGLLYDAAVDEEGNIYVLSFSYDRKGYIITLCNYRGDPIREVTITKTPPEFEGLLPNHMIYRNGTLYFVSDTAMTVIMTDANGVFKDGVDLFPLMDIKPEKSSRYRDEKDPQTMEIKRSNYGIAGFFVDHEGNLLFTSPITATAYVVTPDRRVESFGKRGSAPGRFAVPRGMARDKSGNYIVSDILRCVVMVFDKDFVFITEFGYRGLMPDNLIGPSDLAIDDDSKIYVAQLMERGVSVFRLVSN